MFCKVKSHRQILFDCGYLSEFSICQESAVEMMSFMSSHDSDVNNRVALRMYVGDKAYE